MLALPYLFQTFVVKPNELSLETPYLNHYIAFTRKAYKLDGIQETAYPALSDLTPDVIARNQDTIQNIRLWDSRPLLQTYQQTQAIRLYYQFYNVDVDRYRLPDGYHQVMLASRELASQLPSEAQTWVNENLQFTHGEGLVMNFVSNTTGGGLPQYLLENVPAESQYGMNITQPAIYFGEVAPGYKIVSTGIKEFDYPKGNENVYASYQGKGGIPLDSIWKRLLFAWTQKDINILLTSYLTPQSRIQIWRSVQERVAQVAPFLLLDQDPYAVLSEGKLYWIQDAYTVSDRFPYSNPQTSGSAQGMNYIRNSVKAVVDMYDGTVSLYVMDSKDPVLGMYERAFPGVFKDLSELPADLKAHLRYPEDLFGIQSTQYETFHMTDPQVFYNREDLWVPPQEKYDGAVNPMDPYYMLMKLPGSGQLEYLIMTPFTPQKRDNMIAWLAARCDFPDYGKMLFYELPKDKLIFGPNQISAMIDQSTTISQQLTLWDQKGSGVIRGKLIVIPIENSFLYVVPLYLKAEGTNFPQLKRVIVATGDKVVMEPTLDEALSSLFGTAPPQSGILGGQQKGAQAPLSKATRDQAMAQLAAAQKAINALKQLLANSGSIGWLVPQVLGVGYTYVGSALDGTMALKLMLLLVVLKLFGVTVSYASGNAGGIFGPSLFLGAMLGGAIGTVAHRLLPGYTATPGAYALVGMGALFAGIVRAPMTSVLMIFEMTRDYAVIVPLMIANLTSFFISSRFQKQPIYDALAHQDGIHLPSYSTRDESSQRTVAKIMRKLSADALLRRCALRMQLNRLAPISSASGPWPTRDTFSES